MNAWLMLAAAIAVEVAGTIFLKLSQGMTRWLPATGMAACYLAAFVLMSFSLKSLEVGTAYSIWAGAGTALVTVAGVVWFGESLGWLKMLGTVLIVVGVVLLRFSTQQAE